MKFTDYIKQEKPELVESFNILSELGIKVIEDYANFMLTTNGTGILPKSSSNDDDKKYRRKCTNCGEYYMSYRNEDGICHNCLPF